MKIRHSLVSLVFVCAAMFSPRRALAQFSQQGGKLVGSDANFGIEGVVGVYQGWSTAISADGNTGIIGGYADNNGNGATWVFTRNSGSGAWTQQGPKLFVNVGGGDFQGIAVGLSGDGNTAIIGADVDGNGIGAAYIWTRSGGVWHYGTKLVGSNVLGGQALQGFSVALSLDGHTAIVGGTFDDTGVGAAWIFTGSGASWHEERKLVGSGSVGPSEQGWSVALSLDGNTAAVGGYTDNTTHGAVWIYTRSGGTWTQQGAKLTVAGNAAFGSSVSLSIDGNIALLGGYSDNSGAGAAWVWTRSGSVWTQQGNKLVANDAGGLAQQGASVSLDANGNTALIGGPGDNGGAGASWIWTRSGAVWTQQGAKLVGSGAVGAASQGHSVSLSGDADVAIVGGYSDGNDGNGGAAWIFGASSSSSGCVPSGDTLCLSSGRFRVNVTWKNQHANPQTTGAGYAIVGTDQTGRFWFFDPSAVELLIKIVDGRALNGSFWIFYGALSDVEYTITVADTVTGKSKTYHNAPGNICGGADLNFSSTASSSITEDDSADSSTESDPSAPETEISPAFFDAPENVSPEALCTSGPGNLCLLSNRFRVSVSWIDQHTPGHSGAGVAVPSTDQTGYFYFFAADSLELAVKIVDGRALNNKFWVFYGALSDVEYTITITDTQTGGVKTFHNLPGVICGGADTAAFPGP